RGSPVERGDAAGIPAGALMARDLTRRDFLSRASAATLSALAAGVPRAVSAQDSGRIVPTADAVIVLWMAGGMAHTETFDPKRYTPFESGLKPAQVLSTFPSIDTAVDSIKVSKGLERIATVMDRATLIRSYTAGDLGFILHSRHQYQWHTGYAPPQTAAAPHLGAIIARTLGSKNPAVPPFINIGQRLDVGEGEELKAFTTAGFLGTEFGPFGQEGSSYQRDSLLRAYDNAHRLLSSPAAKAFDLSLEPLEHIQKYVPG